jgi:hypothetical protein
LACQRPNHQPWKPPRNYRERYEELTGSSLWQCPVCRQGRMLVTQILPRRPLGKCRLRIPHDEEDSHKTQKKSFRASLAGQSDRSGFATRFIAKGFFRHRSHPVTTIRAPQAARPIRSAPARSSVPAASQQPGGALLQPRPSRFIGVRS